MRCIMTVKLPVETSNEAIKSGKLQKVLQSVVDDLKPEAVYYYAVDGKRGGIFVFDLKEPSQIPAAAEPFFLGLNASVEFAPCMKPEDLAKAGPAIEKAIKKHA
ncbi:MAG TPA: hypothetical protein VGS20_02625 [Candidatus Acidoferrales bacterium]|nr:hypothetical protein [Candidatus Acidoferrales bacterium]